MRSITIKKETIEISFTDEQNLTQLPDQANFVESIIEDNKDSELIRDLKDYTNLLSRDLKESKLKSNDFSPNGTFASSLDFWKQHWEQVCWCIENDRCMLILGHTQIGKTKIFQALAYLLLKGFVKEDGTVENPKLDCIIITTNNSKNSAKQIIDRTKKLFANNYDFNSNTEIAGSSIHVDDANNLKKDERIQPGSVIVSISNPFKNEHIKKALEYTIEERDKFYKYINKPYKDFRVGLFNDEGDLADQNYGDTSVVPLAKSSKTEKTLYNFNHVKGCKISWAHISATLRGVFHSYPKICGSLNIKQIFQVPIPKEYRGFVDFNNQWNLNHTVGILVKENPILCKNGKYSSTATIHNTRNPKKIAETIIEYFTEKEFNPLQVPQIATVILGTLKTGHTRTGKLIKESFDYLGQKACIIDTHDIKSNLNRNSEYVIVVHNGNTDDLKPDEKIKEIIDQSETKLKGIIFVGGVLLGRAITFAAPKDVLDQNSKYFGAYCNLTFGYMGEKPSLDQLLQSHRGSGVWPTIKQHRYFTVEWYIPEIKNHLKGFNNAVEQLAVEGETNGTIPIEFDNDLRISAARRNSIIGAKKGRSERGEIKRILNEDREDIIKNGITIKPNHYTVKQSDYYWSLDKQTYDKISKSKTLAEQWISNQIGKQVNCVRFNQSLNPFVPKKTHAQGTTCESHFRSMMRHQPNGNDNPISFWKYSSPGGQILYNLYYQDGSYHNTDHTLEYEINYQNNLPVAPFDKPKNRSKLMAPPNSTGYIEI